MGGRISSPIFVGRRRELEQLEAALDAAASGQPSLVLVAGEAGVGKSRLVAELAACADARGARTIAGGCLDLGGGGLPFAPFAEALRDLEVALRRESGTAVEAVFGSSTRILAALVPDLGEDGPADQGRADPADLGRQQARLFDAVLAVLGRLAATAPLLLVLEDLHWADGSTRDLLRFLLRNMRDERILIVGTFRSDDLHRRHPLMPLLAELERSDRVARLDVQRFDRDEIVEQLGAILGNPPEPALVDSVVERSDGLPFFVEELVAQESNGGAVPVSLREILGQRLGSLPDPALSVVRVAAVIGGRFTYERLAAVTGLDEAALLGALRDAIEGRVLVADEASADPAYAFRHALLREVAYDELLPTERVLLHAQLCDALERASAKSSSDGLALMTDLAVHAYHAGDQPRALAAAARAVRGLADAGAFREAFVHAERALALWPRVADAEARAGISHGELHAVAGRMAANAGRTGAALAHAESALAELEASAPPERLAELLIDVIDTAVDAEAVGTARAAAVRLRDVAEQLQPSRLQVHALIIVADSLGDHLREAADLTERSMAIAKSLDDDRTWALAATEHANFISLLGRVTRAEALVSAASASGTGFDAIGRSVMADENLSAGVSVLWVWWLAGRFEDSARQAAAGRRAAIRYGIERRQAHWYAAAEAFSLYQLGRLEEAERLASPVARRSASWIVVLKVHVVRGRLDAARGVRRWNGPGAAALDTLAAEAFLERAAGSFDRIRVIADEANAMVERGTTDAVAPMWLLLGTAIGAAADHAVAARRRRRPTEAADAVELGRRWLGQLREIVAEARADGGAGRWCEAVLATAEGELQRLEDTPDPATWRTAAVQWRALSDPYDAACAELRLAEALLATDGDRAEVARLLRAAHAATIALDAVRLGEEIEAVARHARFELAPGTGDAETGSTDHPATDGARSPLTARERDVLRLVAEGHTNREIGDELFISEKTVSVHVSNAMAKLGALSRYEAAAAAERGGFLD